MKNFSKIKVLGACLVLGFGFNSFAEREVKNYYLNGVGSGEEQTINDAFESADALKNSAFPNIDLEVGVLLNNSKGKFPDIMEAISQSTNLDDLYRSISNITNLSSSNSVVLSELLDRYAGSSGQEILLKSSKLISFSGDGSSESMQSAISSPFDYTDYLTNSGFSSVDLSFMYENSSFADDSRKLSDVLTDLISIDGYYGSVAYQDKQNMKGIIQNQLDLGNKVNIVSHSQGNFFANQVLYENFSNRTDDIKLLSVATPDNKVYGNGNYVTLYEDFVSYTFLGSYARNETNHYFQVGDSFYEPYHYATINDLYPLIIRSINKSKYDDVTGHGFVTAYLHPGSQSKGFIVEHVNENYLSLLNSFPEQEPEVDYSYEKDIYLGQTVHGKFLSVEESKYRSGRYARTYNLHFNSCTKVQVDLESSVDTFLYMHANNKRIGLNDDGGEGTNSRIVLDLVGGNYEVEATTFSSGKTGDFTLKAKSLGKGNCSSDWSDIYLTNTSISETSVEKGGELQVYVTQNYRGTIERTELPEYPKVGYYLSEDKNLDSSDIYLDYDRSSIGSDDLYDDESEKIVIPANINVGRHYILFIADYLDKVDEINENNNVEYEEIYITNNSSSDDIYLTNLSVDENQPDAGDDVYIRVRINYQGNSSEDSLGKVYTSYYISSDYSFNSNAIYLDYDVSYIGYDDLYDDERETVTIPSSLSSGVYYLYIVTDNKNGSERIDETNENNNIGSIPIFVH